MIDVHSHILPCMDDGSQSVEESLRMLAASAAQGILKVAATPHFYPMENDIEHFLERRKAAVMELRTLMQPGIPELLLGAEIFYFDGMSHVPELGLLRIEGTPFLLIEMPFSSWSERVVREIANINLWPGVSVVLAHIERYLSFPDNKAWLSELRDAGILMQSNADFFLRWRSRYRALRMLKHGEIHLLGSDCHNMGSRAPHLGEALRVIGPAGRQMLENTLEGLLPEPAERR